MGPRTTQGARVREATWEQSGHDWTECDEFRFQRPYADEMKSSRGEAERQDGMLPNFASVAIAERELFGQRDRSLRWLESFARKHSVELARTPADLESLEDLYFRLFEDGGGWLMRRNRSTFEFAMGVFLGAVAVAHGAQWSVYESPFAPGHFGLAVSRGLLTVVLNEYGTGWDRRPNNRRRRLLRRDYDKNFGESNRLR